MYRIKLLGTSWKGMVRALSLQNREYGTDLEDIKYVNSFPDHSVLDKSFRTEEEARLAIAKSYRGVDDYGLALTWTVIRRGSIVVTGAETIHQTLHLDIGRIGRTVGQWIQLSLCTPNF